MAGRLASSMWKASFKDVLGCDGEDPVQEEPAVVDDRPRCRFFQAGNCKFGSRCRFSHRSDFSSPVATKAAADDNEPKECGICIEPPASALYGLLSHCDCKFCLECIRGWRKDGIEVAKNSERVRMCPLCRNESFFIVPSVRFVRSGPEKDALIETYKQALNRIPCKNFATPSGCKFGSSCFYYHDLELERQQRKAKLGDFLAGELRE